MLTRHRRPVVLHSQAGADKNARDEQRQQILRQTEQGRQRGNDRDAAER